MFTKKQQDAILNFALQAGLTKVEAGADDKTIAATVKAVVDAALAVEKHFSNGSIVDRVRAASQS